MKETVEEFRSTIEAATTQLRAITEAESGERPAPTKWSKKEIIGHLIDSASNNQQRFVRLQLSEQISLPSYEQEGWVRVQQYQNESWEQVVQLWRSYNLHLLHLMACVPEDKLQHMCAVGDHAPVTLGFLMVDYVQHLKHHLYQALPDFDLISR